MSPKPPSSTESAADKSAAGAGIRREIEHVVELVAAARRLLAEGKPIDLADLSGRVDTLCQNIHENPPQNPRDVRQALDALVNDLDTLEHELTEQHRRLEENLAERTRKLAVEAYSDPTDETPPGTNKDKKAD